MQISVPFFRQKTEYSCGPACLRMMFAYHHTRVGEEVISESAGTNPRTGTARAAMLRAARMHGFVCRMSSNGTWSDVLQSLKEGMPVLINYREPSKEEGHYALVTGIRGDRVLLNDPWNGHPFSLPINELKRRWLGHRTREKNIGWMMTVSSRM